MFHLLYTRSEGASNPTGKSIQESMEERGGWWRKDCGLYQMTFAEPLDWRARLDREA